jgi:hypothetical protein
VVAVSAWLPRCIDAPSTEGTSNEKTSLGKLPGKYASESGNGLNTAADSAGNNTAAGVFMQDGTAGGKEKLAGSANSCLSLAGTDVPVLLVSGEDGRTVKPQWVSLTEERLKKLNVDVSMRMYAVWLCVYVL